MGILKKLVAVSWTMPPIVLPRSIQVARTLKVLRGMEWEATVLSVPVDAVPGANLDEGFATHYRGAYEQIYVEHREDVAQSTFVVRQMRKWAPVENVDEANWIGRCCRRIGALRRAGRCDVLVTFAQPWINHAVGIEVKRRRWQLPWVAHFSDPWVDSPYYDSSNPEVAAKLERWREQEAQVITEADIVVFVTRQTADLVMRKYPEQLRGKVRVVPHGYDRTFMPDVKATASRCGPLRIVHTGNIYAGIRDPLTLFEALLDVERDGPLDGRIAFDFYGFKQTPVIVRVEQMGLGRLVRFHGPVGYQRSLEVASQADLLLLMDAAADVNVFLPSKIVDYLMLAKPILALSPQSGASAEILSRAGHIVIDPKDTPGMRHALATALNAHQAGKPLATIRADVAAEFDIQATTRTFETVLRDALKACLTE